MFLVLGGSSFFFWFLVVLRFFCFFGLQIKKRQRPKPGDERASRSRLFEYCSRLLIGCLTVVYLFDCFLYW